MATIVALGCIAPSLAYADGKISINNAVVNLSQTSYTYNGQAQTPGVSVVLDGKTLTATTDYTVSYSNNKNAGMATATVRGAGNYEGSKAANFSIKQAPIKSVDITPVADKVYTGSAITPTPPVYFNGSRLTTAKSYSISYKNNLDAGRAQITYTGKGNFTGTTTVGFTIVKANIAKASFGSISTKTYTGEAFAPKPKIVYKGKTLREDVHYTLSYKNCTNAGTGKVTVKGKGNFENSKTLSFTIKKASAKKMKVGKISSRDYTGKSIKPTPSVSYRGKSLKKNKDYSFSYKSNTNAGTAKLIVKGKGKNFTSSKTVTFKINKARLDDTSIYDIPDQSYRGGDQVKPNPTIKFNGKTLKKDKDYKLSYKNNTRVGLATVTITGKGNFTGKDTEDFTIVPRSLDSGDVSISYIDDRQYTGSPITPDPVVRVDGRKLNRYSDYNLYYQNNIYVGTAFITIVGINGYTDDRTVSFHIVNNNY